MLTVAFRSYCIQIPLHSNPIAFRSYCIEIPLHSDPIAFRLHCIRTPLLAVPHYSGEYTCDLRSATPVGSFIDSIACFGYKGPQMLDAIGVSYGVFTSEDLCA